jgi:hypothetical protein
LSAPQELAPSPIITPIRDARGELVSKELAVRAVFQLELGKALIEKTFQALRAGSDATD